MDCVKVITVVEKSSNKLHPLQYLYMNHFHIIEYLDNLNVDYWFDVDVEVNQEKIIRYHHLMLKLEDRQLLLKFKLRFPTIVIQ